MAVLFYGKLVCIFVPLFICLPTFSCLLLIDAVWDYVSHDIVCYVRQISLSVCMSSICLNCIEIFQ